MNSRPKIGVLKINVFKRSSKDITPPKCPLWIEDLQKDTLYKRATF